MTLFSTGYFSLSEDDVKNLKTPCGFYDLNNYSKLTSIFSKLSKAFFIFSMICFFLTTLFVKLIYDNETFKCAIISQIILIVILLLPNIFSILEVIYKNKIFKISGFIPFDIREYINKTDDKDANIRFWINMSFLIYNLALFFILIIAEIIRCAKGKKTIFKKNKMSSEALLTKKVTPSGPIIEISSISTPSPE